MEPNHAEGPRSRQAHDWPRWGAALDAAALIVPAQTRLARVALPAGLALVALAAFALSPAEAERHGAAASPHAPTVLVR